MNIYTDLCAIPLPAPLNQPNSRWFYLFHDTSLPVQIAGPLVLRACGQLFWAVGPLQALWPCWVPQNSQIQTTVQLIGQSACVNVECCMQRRLLMLVQRDSLLCEEFSSQKQLSENVDQSTECGSVDRKLLCSVKLQLLIDVTELVKCQMYNSIDG